MSYHFIPRRMSKIKKTRNTSVGKDGEHCCWSKGKTVQLVWRTVWQCWVKLSRHLPYDTSTPSYLLKWKLVTTRLVQKCSQYLIHKSPKTETIQMSINRRTSELWHMIMQRKITQQPKASWQAQEYGWVSKLLSWRKETKHTDKHTNTHTDTKTIP